MSRSHRSMCAFALDTPRGHKRSTSTRVPSPWRDVDPEDEDADDDDDDEAGGSYGSYARLRKTWFEDLLIDASRLPSKAPTNVGAGGHVQGCYSVLVSSWRSSAPISACHDNVAHLMREEYSFTPSNSLSLPRWFSCVSGSRSPFTISWNSPKSSLASLTGLPFNCVVISDELALEMAQPLP